MPQRRQINVILVIPLGKISRKMFQWQFAKQITKLRTVCLVC